MTPADAACWFVDPYPVDSHRFFREQWLTRSRYRWQTAELPARGWRWRLRFGAAVLAERIAGQEVRPKIVVTTSMCDASQLRARLSCPVVVYWHENQLTYAREGPDRLGAALRHSATLLSTPWHLINSRSHRDAFVAALERDMRGWDRDSRLGILLERAAEMRVVAPPVPLPAGCRALPDAPPLLLWNHRWCEEKRPDWLLIMLRRLVHVADLDFRLAVVGSANEASLPAFEDIRDVAGARLVAFGHQPRERYEHLLSEAAIVLSTAAEENFGIAVAEAVAHGALPVLPELPIYRELWGDVATIFATPEEGARVLEQHLRARSWADEAGREARHVVAGGVCDARRQAAELDDVVARVLRQS